MIWVIITIVGLAIYGMIWVGRLAYKTGEKQGNDSKDHHIHTLKNNIIELRIEISKLKQEKEKWELRFDEMEIRWRESKRRREELRLEKLELEARLSDLCGQTLIN